MRVIGIELGLETGLAFLILKPVGLQTSSRAFMSLLTNTLAVILSKVLGLMGKGKKPTGFGPKQAWASLSPRLIYYELRTEPGLTESTLQFNLTMTFFSL